MKAFNHIIAFASLLLLSTNNVGVHGARKSEEELSLEAVEAEVAVVAKDNALMGKLFPLVSKLFKR